METLSKADFNKFERLNDRFAEVAEALACVSHMVEVCDQSEAPMPYQLAQLLNVLSRYTAETGSQLGEDLRQFSPWQ
ncbi:hypothetical protein [Aggregatibacter sp.]